MGALNKVILSCTKATFLMSKKEEGKISVAENFQLRMHLAVCKFCNRFQKQTQFFTSRSKELHHHTPAKQLTPEKKEAIRLLLKD